jgi:hypothetical protein
MKTFLRLAVLAVVGTTALALAGNALATQKLSVRQTPTSLTVKISQAQTDPQPAKITVYVPSGYTINAAAAAGAKIGTATGTVFVRDQNIPLPLSGDVVVAPPNTNATGCATGTHLAVWVLELQVAGQSQQLPVHVDPTAGAETALGAYKLVICLPPADVPQGTPGRAPNGSQLLDATFEVDNVFTAAPGDTVWKAFTTPWKPGVPVPNPAGTVETRALVSNGTVTLNAKALKIKGRRYVRATGKVTQAGAAVAGTQVSLLLNGKLRFRTKPTSAAGAYSIVLQKKGKKTTTTFQTRVTVAERDATTIGCASPSLPNVPCVNATSSGFTAVSRKIRIRL